MRKRFIDIVDKEVKTAAIKYVEDISKGKIKKVVLKNDYSEYPLEKAYHSFLFLSESGEIDKAVNQLYKKSGG